MEGDKIGKKKHPNLLYTDGLTLSEKVWAKGSSKSGGMLYIFTCSSLHILTCSHTHIFTNSHLHIFLPSHTLTSSHLLIFTSSHLHPSHIFSLSLSFSLALHLHIFTSSYLHILTSSHLLIFTSSHLHILTSSHSVSLSLSPLSLSLSLSSSLSLSRLSLSLYLSLSLFSLKAAGSANEAPQYGHPFARNEVRVSKLGMFCNLTSSAATLSQENEVRALKSWGVFCDFTTSAATLEVWVSKTDVFFSILPLRWQPLLRANAEDVTSQKTISFLTTEPHFVRKGLPPDQPNSQNTVTFWLLDARTSFRAKGFAVEDVKSQKISVFDTRTSFRAKRLPREDAKSQKKH